MYFRFDRQDHWTPLSWLAICEPGQACVSVRHGRDVETRDDWFCEAVWDGDFERGDFDCTDIVFGSGGRIRNKNLIFVSSGSTCDRLHHIEVDSVCYISNSLICLVTILDIEFDPWYPGYYEDFCTIGQGIDNYKTSISSSRGDISLTYYRNVSWDGMRLKIIEKPDVARSIDCFHDYELLLLNALKEMQKNMSAISRRLVFAPISTCSSGYDSLAVSVLAREIGTREAICVPQDRLELNDSGIELIQQLEMQALVIERDAWRQTDFAETMYIAADACGRDVWLLAASEQLVGRVVLTGYFGDAVWTETPMQSQSRFFRTNRTGPAGVSLGEFRLHAGFIHCPVPFIASQAIQSSHLVSINNEMKAWRLNTAYDRPVPRRIIEAAGIRREQFGTRKTATAVHLFRAAEFQRFFAGTESFRDYMRWIRHHSRRHAPPASSGYKIRSPSLEEFEVPLARQLFPWAVDRCKHYYQKPE